MVDWIHVLTSFFLLCDVTNCICNFGPGCSYPCRCVHGTRCDPENGECPNGCEPGWGGHRCGIGTNIALHRATATSSLPFPANASSDKANDGNTGRGTYSVIHGPAAWWRVGFDNVYRISRIILYLPETERSKPLRVTVIRSVDSLGSGQSVTCADYKALTLDSGGTVMLQCPAVAVGDSLLLYREGSPLTLCEVQVRGQVIIAGNTPTTTESWTTVDCLNICGDNATFSSMFPVPEACEEICGVTTVPIKVEDKATEVSCKIPWALFASVCVIWIACTMGLGIALWKEQHSRISRMSNSPKPTARVSEKLSYGYGDLKPTPPKKPIVNRKMTALYEEAVAHRDSKDSFRSTDAYGRPNRYPTTKDVHGSVLYDTAVHEVEFEPADSYGEVPSDMYDAVPEAADVGREAYTTLSKQT